LYFLFTQEGSEVVKTIKTRTRTRGTKGGQPNDPLTTSENLKSVRGRALFGKFRGGGDNRKLKGGGKKK